LLSARQLAVNRQKIDAVVLGVKLDDIDEPLLIAEAGDAALERILHHQFRRN